MQWDMGDWKAPLSPSYSSSPLFLHHDQHGKVLAAYFPLDRSSTKTKQRKKTKCTRVDVSPAARSVHCVGGPPLSAHRMWCISGRAAGGRLRQTGRKDQPQRSTHALSHTHTHTLSVCIFSHNGQQHRDIIWLPTCRTRQRSVRNSVITYNHFMQSQPWFSPPFECKDICNLLTLHAGG